jgi:competence protein ComEC
MKNRVLFQGVVALVLGMMVSQYALGIQRDIRPLVLMCLASAVVLLLGQNVRVFVLGALCGVLLVPVHQMVFDSTPKDLWQATELLGKVESSSRVQESVVLRVLSYRNGHLWQPVQVRVKVYGVRGAMAGETLHIEGAFKPLKIARNPFDFDQRQSYYARGLKGIYYTAPEKVTVYAAPVNPVDGFLNAREKWLRQIEDASEYGGYWTGFVLGEDEAIPEEAITLIRRTGLAHVLAVSGMHVVLVYGFVSFVIGKFIKRRQIQDGIIVVFLVFYLGLNLMSFTVMRAVALLVYHRFAFYGARRPDAVTAIGMIAAVNLLFNSYDLFDLSFLLCIGATLSIAFLYGPIQKSLRVFGEPLASSLGIILAAQLGVLPIQLYVFNILYPESLVYNLLFVPIFSVVICLSFVFSLLSFIPFALPILAVVFDVFMGLLENTLWQTTKLFHFPISITGSQVMMASVIGLTIILGYKLPDHKRRWALAGICVFFLSAILATNAHGFRILIFSTGKSDAMVIQNKGHNYMIDTGAGKTDLGLLLLKNDIRHLDHLIITHSDQDHIGGLPDIQATIEVDQLIQGLSGPSMIEQGDLSLQLFYGDSTMSDNDGSIVTLLTYDTFSMLFMGDAESKREKTLVDQGLIGEVDAIKIGHHGSNTSTSQLLLDITKPKLALICSDGSKHFPRQDIVERLLECGILVYRTDESGCVELTIEADHIQINEYLRSKDEL